MTLDDVLARVRRSRPRVAEELARPHAEEMLLAGVVLDLLAASALDALAEALALPGPVDRVILWGADAETGVEDLTLAAALRRLAAGGGRAALADLEPDLVVVTEQAVGVVDASVGRPGHLAARAARGEPVAPARTAAVSEALVDAGMGASEPLGPQLATAQLAGVALLVGHALDLHPHAIALGAPSADLLHPERDHLGAWAAHAAELVASSRSTPPPVDLRVTTWLDVARRLGTVMGAERAVRRIRSHPVVHP